MVSESGICVPVTIYLANGFQLRGLVRGFDNFTIILDSEGKPELVYKHAISTIIPARPLREFSGEPGLSKEPKLDEV